MGAGCQRGKGPVSLAAAAANEGAAASASGMGQQPVLLLDIMDTVVYDPFFQDMPRFFGCTFKELLAAKHPTAWLQFERDEIEEEELFRIFFADGRPVDGAALKQHMADCYRYLEGMEALLDRLAAGGTRMHAFSNYPAWWACGCIALGVAYNNVLKRC
ncbi:hypothetical protein COHA_009393 [Chlorella ohadii]|uniref:Uncharacterized protein n=1 Tax=Chlorella ohadii TaxID=2649997 RepID=A0AAD5DEV3_9CHLO|nr:hypothetical protein COHA_009393 [Chlorella ohadii]